MLSEYRTKITPVFHAVLWTGNINDLKDMPDYADLSRHIRVNDNKSLGLWIGTEYETCARVNLDYIVRDDFGRFFIVDKSTFDDSYSPSP